MEPATLVTLRHQCGVRKSVHRVWRGRPPPGSVIRVFHVTAEATGLGGLTQGRQRAGLKLYDGGFIPGGN